MAHIDRLSVHQHAEMMAFSRRLVEQMARTGMSNSDLARAIWGTTVEGSKTVAKNRDRISLYVNSKQMPEPVTVEKLAFALGCSADDLVPNITSTPRSSRNPVHMTLIGGRPDLALLTINQILPTTLATKVLSLIAKEPEVELVARVVDGSAAAAAEQHHMEEEEEAVKQAVQAANRARVSKPDPAPRARAKTTVAAAAAR